jgi:hypothetical protein
MKNRDSSIVPRFFGPRNTARQKGKNHARRDFAARGNFEKVKTGRI